MIYFVTYWLIGFVGSLICMVKDTGELDIGDITFAGVILAFIWPVVLFAVVMVALSRARFWNKVVWRKSE